MSANGMRQPASAAARMTAIVATRTTSRPEIVVFIGFPPQSQFLRFIYKDHAIRQQIQVDICGISKWLHEKHL